MKTLNSQSLLRYLLLMVGIFSIMAASGDPIPGATFSQWLTTFSMLVAVAAACFYGVYRIGRPKKTDGEIKR